MLKEFSIAYLKAYRTKQKIEFAQPIDGKLGLTILVGKNNSGKSTILNLIGRLFDNNTEFILERDDIPNRGIPAVSCLFRGANQTETRIKIVRQGGSHFRKKLDEKTTATWSSTPPSNFTKTFLKIVKSRRPWSDSFNIASRSDPDSFETNEKNRQKNQESPLGQALNELQRDNKKESFDTVVRKIIPEFCDWSTERILGTDYVFYLTENGSRHVVSETGDGISSILRICYTLVVSGARDTILIDEPELSLHPDAQKRLYAVLREFSKDRQIILSTHSTYFVNWIDLIMGAKLIRVLQDKNGNSRLCSVSEEVLQAVSKIADKDKKNRKLYDVLAKELFFSDKVVFVEGQEDVHIVNAYLEDNDLPSIPFFGYGAGGASHIINWLKLARELNVRAVGVFDGDQKSKAVVCKREFKNDPGILVHSIAYDDIRDKHLRDGKCETSGKCKETDEILKAGFFDKNWNINPAVEKEFLDYLKVVRDHLDD